MIEATLADRDSIRVANEALAEMRQLGATLVDPLDFNAAIAEVMTAYEPSFFTQVFPEALPAGSKPMDRLVAIASDPKALPGGARGVNLRMNTRHLDRRKRSVVEVALQPRQRIHQHRVADHGAWRRREELG